MLPRTQKLLSYKSITENCWPATLERNHRKATEYTPCVCEHKCGPFCLNAQTSVECDDGLCMNGPHCGNRQVQNRDSAAVVLLEPDKTDGKGWRLATANRLHAEEHVLEHVGEVVTAEENSRRTTRRTRKNPNQRQRGMLGASEGGSHH